MENVKAMSFRKLLRCKLHGAVVTHADLRYEGSISLSPELLAAADLVEFEAVSIWNVTNGERFETYTIKGEAGSTDISVNGAAARLVQPGDKLIIASFGHFPEDSVSTHTPKVVFLDGHNRIKELRPEIAGPKLVAV